MNRTTAIKNVLACKGRIYTTDEMWADDENCILSDALGNLIYGNGELVENEEELPLDGWWDATDDPGCSDEDEDFSSVSKEQIHEDVLWDPDDM